MTLFELDNAELDLLARVEAVYEAAFEDPGADHDPSAEAQAMIDAHLEALGEVQEQIGAKLVGYVRAIHAKRARAAILDAEMAVYFAEYQRLKRQQQDEEDTADTLEERLKAFLDRREITEIEAGTYRLKLVNQGGALPVVIADGVQPEDLPESCRRVIPARTEFDRAAIARAIAAGAPLTVARSDDSGQEVSVPAAWLGLRPKKLKIK